MLRKVQSLFERLVSLVEDHPAPLRRYFQLYFAILAVRLCLEFFSSHRLFRIEDVVHIGLWFIFIVLAFLVQLHLFSGERLSKVVRLVIVGFTIALTAPIFDLILHGGVGAKMNYLSFDPGDWQQLLIAYFTMGGPSISRGATLGIRVEILLLVIASFNYVRTKRKSLVWGALAGLSIYTVLFLSGLVPMLLGNMMSLLELAYGPEDMSTVLLLACLDLGLLGIALWRFAPEAVEQALRAAPWGTLGIAVAHLAMGVAIGRRDYATNWHLDPTTLFWAPLGLALLGVAAAYTGLLRTLPTEGEVGRGTQSARNVLVALGLGMLCLVSLRAVFVGAVAWGLLFLLAEMPLRLRRAPLLRNLLEAMALVAMALLGLVVMGGPMVGFPNGLVLALVLAQALGSLWTDIGRPIDDAMPWYGRWLSGFQRLYHYGALLLMLGAWVVLGAYVGASTIQWAMMLGSAALAAGVSLRWPKRVQWALAALLPGYWALVQSMS